MGDITFSGIKDSKEDNNFSLLSIEDAKIKIRRGNQDSWEINSSGTILSDGQPGLVRDRKRLLIGDRTEKQFSDQRFLDYRGVSFTRKDEDINGIFTTIEYKKPGYSGLYKKSVLSGGVSPNYLTRTETYYDTSGNEIYSDTYSISYDSENVFIKETDPPTAMEYDSLNLTATQYDSKEITAYDYDNIGEYKLT